MLQLLSSNLKNPGPSTRRRKNRKEIEQEPVAEEDLVAEAGLNYDEIDFIEQVSARPNPRRQSQRLLEVRRREEVGTDENHERVARAFQMLTDNTSKSSRIPVLHETYTTYYNQLLDKVTETANNKATPASYPVKNSTHDSVLKFYDPHGKGIWWKHMCLVVNPSNINERFVKSSNLGLCKICNCFIPWKSLNQKLGLKHFAICHKEVYDTFFRKEEDTLGEMKVSEVHNLWIDFFMFHNLPLSLCNSPVLKFILNNYYRVPRSYKPLNSKSAQKLVNQIAAAERAKLKAEFDDTVLFYSLTADGWSSRNEVHYLGITVHFLDEHFGYHSHKLDLCEMAGRQGAVHYYTALDTTLQNYGLKKENLAVFARDGASVMANVSNELRMVISDTAYFLEAAEDIHCVAHRLNLIMGLLMFRKKEDLNSDIRVGVALSEHSRDLLGEGFVHDEACWRNIKMNSRLKEVEKNELKNLFPERIKEVISLLSRAKAAVGKARRFSTLYHNSSIVRLKLKEVRQKRISEKATKEDVNKGPVIDVVTRWNSSYVMVERLVELKDDVDSLFQKAADDRDLRALLNKESLKLNVEDWFILGAVVVFTKDLNHLSNLACIEADPNFMIFKIHVEKLKKKFATEGTRILESLKTVYSDLLLAHPDRWEELEEAWLVSEVFPLVIVGMLGEFFETSDEESTPKMYDWAGLLHPKYALHYCAELPHLHSQVGLTAEYCLKLKERLIDVCVSLVAKSKSTYCELPPLAEGFQARESGRVVTEPFTSFIKENDQLLDAFLEDEDDDEAEEVDDCVDEDFNEVRMPSEYFRELRLKVSREVEEYLENVCSKKEAARYKQLSQRENTTMGEALRLYWRKKKENRELVYLPVVARVVLSAQVTSAASERLFSGAGRIFTPLRCNLNAQNAANQFKVHEVAKKKVSNNVYSPY